MSIELPEEYRDWVEVLFPTYEKHGTGPFLAVLFCKGEDGIIPNSVKPIHSMCFVPPKPKPTLPEVKQGAVISFRSYGVEHRAVYHGNDVWDLYWNASIGFCGSHTRPSKQLLDEVDDNGFTVELEGL